MRGGQFHNHVLVDGVLSPVGSGAVVRREVPVDKARRPRAVDAVVQWPAFRLAVEGENRPYPVLRDVAKARDLKANALLIVTPHSRIARRVRARLRQAKVQVPGMAIIVLSQGAARQWVANQSQLMSRPNVLRTSDKNTQGNVQKKERQSP
jgi:hypothetical protein